MRVALGILFGAVIIGLGIWLDVAWFLVGGIEQIVRGFQANPHSGHDIAIGIVRVVLSGISTTVAFAIGIGGGMAIAASGD